MRWRVRAAGLLAIVATVLTVPSAAFGAYWFFQGWMSSPSTVHAFDVSGYSTNYTRMSWTPNSHDMKFSLVDYQGNWHGFDAFLAFGSDQDYQYSTSTYAQGGCNNPIGWWTVYVNCHVGNDP